MSAHDHHDHANMHGNTSMTMADPHAGHAMPSDTTGSHSHMNHASANHSSVDHSMKTYFHVSNEATILFYSWTTTTAAGMFGSCLVVIILSLLNEGLKVLRDRLFLQAEIKRKKFDRNTSVSVATVDSHFAVTEPKVTKSFGMAMLSKDHAFQTLLQIIQIGLSYLLMLIFMTYNVWLCLAVIIGAGLGYFLFGGAKSRLTSADDYCH